MSLWSPESLHIALFPARVTATKVKRGWRTRLIDKCVVETADPNPDPSWMATVAALEKNLAGFAAPGTPATITVSSRFVRYAIVPWNDKVISVQEQTELARHCFRNIYGDTAAGWEIRTSSGGFRRNALACAVDTELLRAVEKVLAGVNVRVASIQPNFMAACNRFRRKLGAYRSGCVAVLEPGRVALGIFDEGGWRTLSARRIATLKANELVPVLAQELRSADPDGLPEYLFVAAAGPTTNSFFRTRTKAWMSQTRARIPESIQ